MKHHATYSTVLLFSFACLGAGLSGGAAEAECAPAAPAAAAKSSPYVLEIRDGKLLTGGNHTEASLPRIVDELRDIYSDANFVLAPGMESVVIGDLKLRSAALSETLEALRVASGEAFVWHNGLAPRMDPATGLPPAPMLVDPTTGLPQPTASESSLYFLTRDDVSQPNPRRMVQVFNLSGYLEQVGKRDRGEISQSLEEIKGIIAETLVQATQGKLQPADAPSFQFHPGANLFIVIGTSQAVGITEKVINALPGVSGMRGFPPPGPSPEDQQKAMEKMLKQRYGLTDRYVPGPKPPEDNSKAAPPAPAPKSR